MDVVLYTKPGCGLCDEARSLLEELAATTAFDLREIDIRVDPAIFDRYRYRIPIIMIDGREVLEGRIAAADLTAALVHDK